jgi:hypothetical protein
MMFRKRRDKRHGQNEVWFWENLWLLLYNYAILIHHRFCRTKLAHSVNIRIAIFSISSTWHERFYLATSPVVAVPKFEYLRKAIAQDAGPL